MVGDSQVLGTQPSCDYHCSLLGDWKLEMDTGLGCSEDKAVSHVAGRAGSFSRSGVRALLVGAAMLGSMGIACTQLDDATDSCLVLGGDCDAAGGTGGTQQLTPLPEDWQCLAEPPPEMPAQSAPRVTYVVAIVDFDTQPPPNQPTAVPNLRIDVCSDPTCDPPAGPEVVTVGNPPNQPPYVYAISMPYNFSNASLRLSADGYVPIDYIFGGPIVGPPEGGAIIPGQTITVLRTSARDTLYRGIGLPTPASATTGDLAVRALNCVRDASGRTTRAEGVTVEAVPDDPPEPAVAYALSYGNLATKDSLVTDPRGVAGFANLRPQNYRVRGLAPVGEEGLAYGETIAPIRPGVITIVELREGQDVWGQ